MLWGFISVLVILWLLVTAGSDPVEISLQESAQGTMGVSEIGAISPLLSDEVPKEMQETTCFWNIFPSISLRQDNTQGTSEIVAIAPLSPGETPEELQESTSCWNSFPLTRRYGYCSARGATHTLLSR